MKFSEKLIKLRKEKSLSQEELGYELNVTRQTVSKWELGQTTPDMEKLLEMSKLFNISVDELISDNDPACEKKGSIVMEEKNDNNVKTIVVALIIIAIIIGAVVLIVNFSEQKAKERTEQKNREDAERIINSQQELMKDALEKQQELRDRYNTEIDLDSEEQQSEEETDLTVKEQESEEKTDSTVEQQDSEEKTNSALEDYESILNMQQEFLNTQREEMLNNLSPKSSEDLLNSVSERLNQMKNIK